MKNLILVLSILVMFASQSCTKEYYYDYCNCDSTATTYTTSGSVTGDIVDYENAVDGDYQTYGYIQMSKYDNHYYGNVIITLPDEKVLTGYRFKYSFPNTAAGSPCHGYPDPVHYDAFINLYSMNETQYVDWKPIYTSDLLNAVGSDCEIVGEYQYNFEPILSNKIKIEMHGLYWLGGGFQQINYFKLYEVELIYE